MKNPLVSIIIPTYNRAHLIGETLDSIIAQTYTNWECLVVDDGSTDNTDEVMARYCAKDSRFRYYHRPDTHKPGGNGARNYGFLQSEGEYVNWFDSDDLMHPEKIELQLNSIINTNYNYCVCQDAKFMHNNREKIEVTKTPIHSSNCFEDFIKQEVAWMTPSALWKKKFLLRFPKLFDETLKASQEWEFFTRVLNVDPNYLPLFKVLIYIRKHSESIQGVKSLEKRWYRFLTRTFVLHNKKMDISPLTKDYLRSFLMKYYKSFVLARHAQYSRQAFFKYILFDRGLSLQKRYYAFLNLVLYVGFGKGYKFLHKL